jgi:hypothetical protein
MMATMPALRTEITEIVTGLGTLGSDDLENTLDAHCAPPQLRHVGPEHWQRLRTAWVQRQHEGEFLAAFNNGRAFLRSRDGLRGRVPALVEWKGSHRDPADDPVPADLRMDHVYLVSCKYLSRVLHNSSPWALFDRCLRGAQGRRGPGDWFSEVAPTEHQHHYQELRRVLPGGHRLPERVGELDRDQQRTIASARTIGSSGSDDAYLALCQQVAEASARRWIRELDSPAERRAMLWRLLRLASAPYFVLGTGRGGSLRLRVATPWDWQQCFELVGFDVFAEAAGQPRVGWRAVVRDRDDRSELEVRGHVEVRWSHGRLGGNPEAKVYLDTPHQRVPGYFALR